MSFSNPTNRTVSEIRDDIDYNEVLLAGLNPHTRDHPQTKQHIQHVIQVLKNELKATELQTGRSHQEDAVNDFVSTFNGGHQDAPTQQLILPRPQASELNYRFPGSFGHLDPGGHFASDSAVLAHRDGLESPVWGVPQVTNSRNSSGAFSGGSSAAASRHEYSSSESSPALPVFPTMNRKRPRESLSFQEAGPSKSVRATPSPAPTTRATTPSSLTSDFPDDPDLLKMLGGHPRDELREIREIEKELAERKDQERKDRELAQKMQEEQHRPSLGGSTIQSFGIPSLLSRATAQATLDSSGKLRRPDTSLPSAFANSSNPVTFASLSPRRHDPVSYLPQSLKKETSFKPTPRQNEFPNFIDLGSDDEEEETDYGSGIPSSDLMEISPSEFPSRPPTTTARRLTHPDHFAHDNDFARQGSWTDIDSTPPTVSNHRSTPLHHTPSVLQGYSGANLYNPNSYPNQAPASSNWSNVLGNVGQTLSNVATNAINGAYGLVNGPFQGYPDHFPGHGTLGSSANPQLIGDYDHHGTSLSHPHFLTPQHTFNSDLPGNEAVKEYMERINNIRGDSRTSVAELKSLLENIRPDEQLPAHSRVGTPDAMSVTSPLYEHQKLGLTWLQQMEAGSNKGGILADDMGLGKTVQAIALMVTRRSVQPDRRSTLIVAPVALLKQWEREIQLRLKPASEHRLSTYIYHNRGIKASWDILRHYDVVLTTYGTLASEGKRKEVIDGKRKANPNWRPTTHADSLPLLGDDCKWYRVILDEAQCIKNKNTRAAKAAAQLEALSRFCMSGTPMMNNVNELYSLIHFLRIKPYNSAEKFRADFTTPLKSMSTTSQENAMKKLQALLKAVLLRRTKKSLIDGKPILELPERITEIQHAVFSEDEESFYRALETRTKIQFNRYLRANTVGRNYSNVLVLLLRLRQACCHPHLIKDIAEGASGSAEVSLDDMLALAESLAPDVVARIKDQGAIECPICMDSAENATIFIPCGHSTCSECFTKIQDPSQAIAEDGGIAVKCPNCRGKVDPKKVTDFKSFKKIHIPKDDEEDDPVPQYGVESADDSESESDSDEDSDSDMDVTLGGFIVPDDADDDTESEQDDYNKPVKKPSKDKKNSMKGKGKGKERLEPKVKVTLAQLQKESRRNAKARKRYLKRLRKDWQTSAKIGKTIEILQSIEDRKTGEKTIIFSQFTSLLDLLEIPIVDRDWGYRRYDGSMSAIARNDAVIDFSDKKDCKILLVSLKAGNAGLNLTAASQVIIFDPFWNPYIEEQAIDRAHRIGQRLPVQVHRILVPNTVEDRIVTLQEQKRKLIEGALDEKASQNIGRLGERELAFLFGVH